MNYIELINKFWQIHEEHSFGPTEIALFFHLLDINNRCSWKESFKRNNSKIEADLGISFNTLKNARNKLQQSFVIKFITQNGSPNVTYSVTLSNYDEVGAEVRTRFARVLVGVDSEVLPTKDKLNKTKQNLENKVGDGIFFRFGNEKIDMPVSVYFKKHFQLVMEPKLMARKISEKEALEKMDYLYGIGYEFKDNNHFINSFNRALSVIEADRKNVHHFNTYKKKSTEQNELGEHQY